MVGVSPLPGHHVIPPSWSEHHRPTAESSMTSTCVIRQRPPATGWNPQDGTTGGEDGPVVYDGPCRVQAQATQAREAEAAGQDVSAVLYLVALPADAATIHAGRSAGDIVEVTANPDDPNLVGRRLAVIDVGHGSVLWQRNLTCRDDLTANQPPRDLQGA